VFIRTTLCRHAALVALAALALAAGSAQADDGSPAPDPGAVASPAFEGSGIMVPPGDQVVAEPVPPPADEFGVDSIIGLDKRKKVTNTTTFPARATVLVTFTGGSCTGFMIGKDTVATAGHCVHQNGAWRTNVKVYPGRNGASSPYGSCNARQSSKPFAGLFTNANWLLFGDEEYDYGAIKLDCTVGNSTGWYGLWTQNLVGLKETVRGYPGDKPSGTQWLSNDCSNNIFTFVQCKVATQTARQVFYANDTFNGMSGSPVYISGIAGCPCAIGIHAYGLHGGFPHGVFNHGVRTLPDVIDFLWDVRDKP
jgi:glutamyl endopeptidase